MKLEKVVVTNKTGKYPDYRYTGFYVISEPRFYLCGRKTSTFDFDGDALLVYSNVERRVLGHNWTIAKKIHDKVIELGDGIKSPDDCCANPDMEVAQERYNYEVVLEYLKGSKEYKSMSCYFTHMSDGRPKECFIKFIYNEVSYEYKADVITYWSYWYEDLKSKTRACLNCGTCDRTEEEKVINDFEKWLGKEVGIQKRKKMAKDICGC